MKTIAITLEDASIYDVDVLTRGMKRYIRDFAEVNKSNVSYPRMNSWACHRHLSP